MPAAICPRIVSRFTGDYVDEGGNLVEHHTFKLVRTHSSQRPPGTAS